MTTNPPTADSQAGDEPLIYGIDMAAPGGDKTALSIMRGKTMYNFVAEEAEAVLAYAERRATERAIEELERLGNYKGNFDESQQGYEIQDRISALTKEIQSS